METYKIRTLFTLGMEGLHLQLFQFDVLLLEQIPELHSFLSLQGIHTQMYASQWFLTVFAYVFPLPLIYRIYDIMFVEGVTETVMRIALSLLKKSTSRIIALSEFEDIMDCLSTKLIDHHLNNFDLIIQDSIEFDSIVTRSKLNALEEKYYILQENKRNNCIIQENNKPLSHQSVSNKPLKQLKDWFGTMKKSKSKKPSTMLSSFEDTTQLQQAKADETLVLHQQIEDLVSAFSYVEKDNTLLREKITILMYQEPIANYNDKASQHTYSCDNKSTLLASNTSHCHCELEKLLVAANIRINALETALNEQKHCLSYSSSALNRSESTSSNRSSYSASASSTLSSLSPVTSSPPIQYSNYIPLTEKELSLHQQTITKDDITLPSSYYYTQNTERNIWKDV
jgi:hypothetical protein